TALQALDPVAIIHMRAPDEARGAPPAALAARRVAVPVEPGAAPRLRRAILKGGLTRAVATALMVETYADFVHAHSGAFAELLRRVAAADGPVVFHCTAGKDRTGFAAALLLSACGAGWEAVLADYMRTAGLWSPDPGLAALVPDAARTALFGVDPAYLESAFSALAAAHGTPGEFARAALGGDAALDRLRTRLVAA
ncbi:MAG: tyrosine-protein phosphatase, partial [Pseudomonadota bacterium]